jgi:hypothetical protein
MCLVGDKVVIVVLGGSLRTAEAGAGMMGVPGMWSII